MKKSFSFEVDNTTQEDHPELCEEDFAPEPVKPFNATAEQQYAAQLVCDGNPIVNIEAVAGSGKSASLRHTATMNNKPSLLLVFNKNMQQEAEYKFEDLSHVLCKTTHGLAYGVVGKGYQHKLKRPVGRYINVALTGSEVAKFFRIPNIEVSEDKTLTASFIGLIIRDTVNGYENSNHYEITEDDIPRYHMKDIQSRFGKKTMKRVRKLVLRNAINLWEERIDKLSEVCCTHNTYLKLYVLSQPDLSEYSTIYVDEAQDVNSVTLQLIRDQIQLGVQIVAAGDSRQAIYQWRGAINAMEKLGGKVARLSKSFRFGPEVAKIAELILGDTKVEGLETIKSVVGEDVVDTDKPYTILFRTNMALIFKAIDLIADGVKTNVNIDMKDFVNMLRSTQALFNGDLKKVKHENIIPYDTWDVFKEAAKIDRELGRLATLVEDGNGDKIISTLTSYKKHNHPQVTLTSAHKSKGLEWNSVILGNDFPSNYNVKGEWVGLTEEETNLLYVAATRAINCLQINETIKELLEKRGESLPSNPLMDIAESVTPRSIEPKGEMAQLALQEVIMTEDLRDSYANGEMSSEDAYENGFEDELGRSTDYADLKDNRITIPTEDNLNQVLGREVNKLSCGVSMTHFGGGTSKEEIESAVGKMLNGSEHHLQAYDSWCEHGGGTFCGEGDLLPTEETWAAAKGKFFSQY